MKKDQNNVKIMELEKDIVIERLRQAPPTLSISFGMSEGKFMNRDELIDNINKETEVGKNIIKIQMAYLRSFKKELVRG